jgi:hypothetical protein
MIKIQVNSLHISASKIKTALLDTIADYCSRFNLFPLEEDYTILISLLAQDDDDSTSGLVVSTDGPDPTKYLVQIRDPWLGDWEDNPYTTQQFLEVVSHAFIHVCQAMTGRKGIPMNRKYYDIENKREAYFFSPHEIEARALESFYTETIVCKIIQ